MKKTTEHYETCCAGWRRGVWHGGVALLAVLTSGCSDRLLDTGLGFNYLVEAVTGASPQEQAATPDGAAVAVPEGASTTRPEGASATMPGTAATSPIRRLSGENTTWPSLTTVPPRPRDTLPAGTRSALMGQLSDDREIGLEAQRILRHQGIELPTVPPRPALEGQDQPLPAGPGQPVPDGQSQPDGGQAIRLP